MRILDSKNPWLTCPTHSALVPISTTHSLFASISGPLRTPASPLLIFFTGAGGPSACYTGIQRQLSPYIRSLFYDRAGYDRSTLPLDETRILCTATARDLRALLVETGLQGPYLLVAHSFGGIVARTFLHECAEGEVQGMLLFDTATELMLALFPRFPPLELEAVGRDVDLAAITHLQRDAGFSDAEWACAIRAVERSSYALSLEDTHASAHELALHRQIDNAAFGTRPLTVVQCNIASDYQLMYDEGIKLGGGTKEERELSRWFIERTRLYHGQVARAQCGLSGNVEFTYFGEWGHDLPIRQPGMVVDMVRGLLKRMAVVERKGRSGLEVMSQNGNQQNGLEDEKVTREVTKKVGEKRFPNPAMSFLG